MTGIPFDFSAQGQHVPDVKQYICTVKNRAWSCYALLPFHCMLCIAVTWLLGNTIFWLNAFPQPDGISVTLSPCYIMTGKHLNNHHHVHTKFGAYVQTHEEHSSDLESRTVGAICLGPTGNDRGGHYFLSLHTGHTIICH